MIILNNSLFLAKQNSFYLIRELLLKILSKYNN